MVKFCSFSVKGEVGREGGKKVAWGLGGPLRNNCLFQIYGFFCNYFFQFLTLFRIFVSLYVCLSKLKERRSVGVELESFYIDLCYGDFIFFFPH